MTTYFFVLLRQIVKDFYVRCVGRSCYVLVAISRLSEILQTRPSACSGGSLACYSMDTCLHHGMNIWVAGTSWRSLEHLRLVRVLGPGQPAPSTLPPHWCYWHLEFAQLRFTWEGARGSLWVSRWSHSGSPRTTAVKANHCYPWVQRDPFWGLTSSLRQGSSPTVRAIFHWQEFLESFLCSHYPRLPWRFSWSN